LPKEFGVVALRAPREGFMQRFMASGTILEHELSELRLLVERQTGVLLDCPNSALAAHIADYLEHHDLDSTAVLFDRLRAGDQDPALLSQFLDGVVNVSTSFYRHPGAMSALARHALPQILGRKTSDGPSTLRIWSAGCGTGEETYSIAMAISDAFPGTANAANNGCNATGTREREQRNGASRNGGVENPSPAPVAQLPKDWSIHIVGSDLLPSAIAVAERGLYPESALAGLPPATIRSCFSRIAFPNGMASGANGSLSGSSNGLSNGPSNGSSNGGSSNGASRESSNGSIPGSHLLVKPRLRSLVTFNTMNLTKPVYIGRFDCIFCMDVLPHLSRAQRSALVERLHLYLEPGGYLFVSQTEKLCAPNLNFRAETYDGYTCYRKPLAASAAYGR
jgi:chemotaxis methyl-accepting protein methylase